MLPGVHGAFLWQLHLPDLAVQQILLMLPSTDLTSHRNNNFMIDCHGNILVTLDKFKKSGYKENKLNNTPARNVVPNSTLHKQQRDL